MDNKQDKLSFPDLLRIEGIGCKGYGIIPKYVMLDTDLSIESKSIYAYPVSYTHLKGATIKSMDMLPGFDELWYYSAFGISTPMNCILTAARKYGIPKKDLQPLNCKECFSTAYKVAIKYHPYQCKKQGYWESFVNDLNTKDTNPLTSKLLVSIFEYLSLIHIFRSGPGSCGQMRRESLNYQMHAR